MMVRIPDIQYETLHPDGTVTHVRTLRQSSLKACPFVIFDPSHYRADETCKCNDATEQVRMLREWGYTRADFQRVGIKVLAPKGPGRKV